MGKKFKLISIALACLSVIVLLGSMGVTLSDHYRVLISHLSYLLLFLSLVALFIQNRVTVKNEYQQLREGIGKIKINKIEKDIGSEYNIEAQEIIEKVIELLSLNERRNIEIEHRLVRANAKISLLKKKLARAIKENALSTNELQSAYEALKESRDKYENLIIHLEDEYFFYSLSTKGNVLFVSPSVKRILGFNVNEYRANFKDLITPNEINEQAYQCIDKSLKGIPQPVYMLELYDKDKNPRMFEISEVPVLNDKGDLVSIEGLAHDVTDQRKAEDLIKEQEEKYRGVFNYASDFVYLYEITAQGKTGHFIEANKYTYETLGYNHEQLIELRPIDLCVEHEDFKDEIHPKAEKYERVWHSNHGLFITVEISEHLLKIKNKKVVIAVARDISSRKKSEDEIRFMNEELINQKENLEALIDNLTQTQEQLVQSEKMAALGQLIAGVAHEINTPLGAIKASVGNLAESLTSALANTPKLVENKNPEDIKLFFEFFNRSVEKNVFMSSRDKRQKKRELRKTLSAASIADADLVADYLVFMEIYDLDEGQVEKLKNANPKEILSTTRNFVSLRKNTETISVAADKAAKVVFALKKYAHRDAMGEKVPTDIIDGIDTVLTLYNNQMKQGIEVLRNYGAIPTVMCYQDELSQVWTNLVQNAIQAMHQKGTLTVGAVADEKYVTVNISDTGTGIEPDILDKIFDPFFTTKKQGEGSGLGLDIVKKIVDKHGGTIDVYSELSKGATFTVKLPIH